MSRAREVDRVLARAEQAQALQDGIAATRQRLELEDAIRRERAIAELGRLEARWAEMGEIERGLYEQELRVWERELVQRWAPAARSAA